MSRSYKKHEYTGWKKTSKGCRCHGGCRECEDNRTAKSRRRLAEWWDRLKQYLQRQK